MEASLFVGLVAVVIVLLIFWKISSHAPTKRRKPRRVMEDTTSFAAHDSILWGSNSHGGSQPHDQTPSSVNDASTWDASPSDNASSFDSGGGSFDCGGGDAGGGASSD